jgi:hypothetical protein
MWSTVMEELVVFPAAAAFFAAVRHVVDSDGGAGSVSYRCRFFLLL